MTTPGAVSYYRIKLPMEQLAAHGHEVHMIRGADVRPPEAAEWPLIIGQRVDKHGALPAWRRFRARSKLVYETDDDVFSVEPVNWEAYGTYSRADVQDAVRHAAEVANVVTVTTGPLAQVMRQFNDNVVILPNFLPGWVCDLPRAGRERPVAGWSGGASHGRDIQEIASPLRRFLDRHPSWDAMLQGTDYRPTIRHPRVGFQPWIKITEDDRGYYQALDWDIGLAPMAPGGVFNRSKSHVRALEYAARGIPVVASDCEAYRDFVLHGVTGFLVRYDHEWLKYLGELASDEAMRREMGEKAREHARNFTIEGNWQLWEQAYGSLT